MTLRLIFVVLKGSAERARREHNGRAWAVHQTAFLTAYAPDKPGHFIKLDKLEAKAKVHPKAVSWEADLAALSAWAARGKAI